MADASFVPLPGSERRSLRTAEPAGSLDGTERIEVTLVTRRMAELPRTAAGTPARISRDELQQRHGSDPADQALVADVLAGLGTGIEVLRRDPAARLMTISGTISALSDAFGASLSLVTSTGPGGGTIRHRYREGGLQVPAKLDGIVVAVLGLDDRPQARAHFRQRAAAAAAQTSYTPPQVAAAYQFPDGTDGSGQHVAILEFGGGFATSDLDAYFSGLGITPPSITAVSVAGGKNVAGQDPSGADGEVLLDIEVVGSVAPGAAQLVYFAPNSDQGFVAAVTAAVHATPVPTAISISWGESEDSWTAQARTSLDAAIADAVAIGITVCVASGDNGSGDAVSDGQPHCDFPASSPHALACGGTSLQADPQTGAIRSETVWNDGGQGGAGGGGVSDVFALPSWQASAGVPANAAGHTGRGVPDVSGNADPATGYQIRIDGQPAVIGGTSAVAPLWAALACRLAQATGHSSGLIQEILYSGVTAGQAAAGLRDITSGSNGAYQAGPGWDACTGLGSPDGPALLTRVSGAPAA
ncbi:MAG TPA: S53 family peptidase [Streptosporangiaceae bacterium]|nr:S53 family peptidase [Streptosporangiaceae bacterium]